MQRRAINHEGPCCHVRGPRIKRNARVEHGPGFDDEFWQKSLLPSRVPEISFNYGHRSTKESACNCRERLTRATCVRQFSMVVTGSGCSDVAARNDKQQNSGCRCFCPRNGQQTSEP
ncbi:uncharacterized protein LOC122535011 [Frieseomelitta varia]|uniref:uncharacterized protein LOC122535011 n=1 Tax=Frieseomelitta varia TaxID=561572 RepID=UPI001CB685E7|nr:uncharacterized protein LOC122535011 [Frieseomelitta varia]